MVFALRIPCGNQAEIVHEIHQLGNICLSLFIPYRCSVTARLVRTVYCGGYNRGRHGFQFLRGHQSGGVLRTHNIYLHPNIGTCVQNGACFHTYHIFVKYFLDRGQALSGFRYFTGGCINTWNINAQSTCCKTLQLLTKYNRVGSTCPYELLLLRGQGCGNIGQFTISFV